MHNTIILTSGLTGSSVVTGLIARAGYWTGDRTHKKKDYDTFENEELIQLNLALFQHANVQSNYQTNFSQQAIDRIASLSREIDPEPYRAFMRKCESHRPWVWKDPRLWMTIRFWRQVVDLQSCSFVLLTRDHFQCWISSTSRRIIQSYRHTQAYELGIQDSIAGFLEESRLPYVHITYEGLIAKPDQNIARLNRFLGANMTVQDLASVYRGQLYRRPVSSAPGVAKAVLIYLKNYHERADAKAALPAG